MSGARTSGSVKISWYIVLIGYLCFFATGTVDGARGPVFPDLLAEFHLSDSAGSFFFLCVQLAAALNNVLFFRWMEKAGLYRSMQVYCVVMACGLILNLWAGSYALVLVGVLMVGLSSGAFGTVGNIFAAEAVPANMRRRVLGGMGCVYGAAATLSPMAVTALYHIDMGWKVALAELALAPGLLLSLSFFGKRSPYAVEASAAEATGPRPLRMAMFFAFTLGVYQVADGLIGSRAALLARREYGYSLEVANNITAGYFVGVFAGRLLLALVPMPWKSSSIAIFSAASTMVFFALGLMFNPWWLVAAGFTISVFHPSVLALLSDEAGAWAGYAISWCVTLQSAFQMLMHFAVGGLSDLIGLRIAMICGPVALVAVMVMLQKRDRFLRPIPVRVPDVERRAG